MSFDTHKLYMKRCLELAVNGIGSVSPNPMVGSVIVHEGKIIGEGYHKKYGGPHAEVNAINSVKNKELLKEATIYVNLEPCSHFGKTPPCSDLIIRMGIPRVIIGSIDTFSEVSGKGVAKLKSAGIDVKVGVLEEECRNLNIRFFTYHEKKRPYIILKWAETSDGFIDLVRKENDPIGPNWITNERSRLIVHKWRSEEDAILVGTNTALKDNPALNVRDWSGKDPLRIIIDREIKLPSSLKVFSIEGNTLVVCDKSKMQIIPTGSNIIYEAIDFSANVTEQITQVIYKHKQLSVIIEGGAKVIQSFIDAGLWDEARVFIGDKKFGDGINAPSISVKPNTKVRLWDSTLYYYLNK